MKKDLRFVDDNNKVEIFQIDETVFVGSDCMRKAFSNKNSNITLDLVGSQESQSAKVVGALSNKGNYFFWVQPDYFDKDDTLKFMKQLHR